MDQNLFLTDNIDKKMYDRHSNMQSSLFWTDISIQSQSQQCCASVIFQQIKLVTLERLTPAAFHWFGANVMTWKGVGAPSIKLQQAHKPTQRTD